MPGWRNSVSRFLQTLDASDFRTGRYDFSMDTSDIALLTFDSFLQTLDASDFRWKCPILAKFGLQNVRFFDVVCPRPAALFRVSRLRHIVTRVDKMLITDYFIVL